MTENERQAVERLLRAGCAAQVWGRDERDEPQLREATIMDMVEQMLADRRRLIGTLNNVAWALAAALQDGPVAWSKPPEWWTEDTCPPQLHETCNRLVAEAVVRLTAAEMA